MEDYIKHLQSQIEYWQRIALAEREKNIKLEEIIKKIEERIDKERRKLIRKILFKVTGLNYEENEECRLIKKEDK
jgi:hypothetical protein